MKYQYMKIAWPSISELNDFGMEGWEAFATAAWLYGFGYTVLLRRPLRSR